MGVYASYILPLAIVGVPMLWKKLYDAAPDSMMRVAVLEAEASLRSQLVDVEREQNALMVAAYREALDTPRVTQARKALFKQASIEHAPQHRRIHRRRGGTISFCEHAVSTASGAEADVSASAAGLAIPICRLRQVNIFTGARRKTV